MLVFFAINSGVSSRDETGELILLCVGGAFLTPFIGFLIRCLFVTPGILYRELEEQLENSEAKLKERDKVKPLEIRPLAVKNTPRYDGLMLSTAGGTTLETGMENACAAECHFEIYNPNQGVDVVRVRILKIEPSMPSKTEPITTDDCNLRALYFPFTDIPDDVLNTNSNGDVCVFKILRTLHEIIVRFDGKWNDTCPNSFSPKNEHFITIQAEAKSVPPKEYQFKMSFSLDPTQPVFILEKIEPPLALQPPEIGGDKIQDKTKKHRDPASVIILLCLISSLLMVAVAQRFQILKLKNPPTPKSIATKPIPDKIIPQSELPVPTVPPPAPVRVEVSKQFETNPPDTNDAKSELWKLRAENSVKIKTSELNALRVWTNDVPIYNYAIQELYDILSKEAVKCGDGIAKTSGYFRCIPTTPIDDAIGETNIAEIRFINKTNLSFQIVITPQNRSNGEITGHRELHIRCSAGGLFLNHQGKDPAIGIRIPEVESWATITDQDIVKQKLKLLIASQIEFVDSRNKQ